MPEYTLEVRDGSPGYVFATRDDGKLFEVYLQYGAVEPRIEDAEERTALVALCRAYRPPKQAPPAPRDRSRDIPDVREQMRRAGFDEEPLDRRGY
jgi:hypothetical protein